MSRGSSVSFNVTVVNNSDTQFAAEFAGPGKWRVKMGTWYVDLERWVVWGASWVPTLWRDLPDGPVGVLEDYVD